MRPKPALIMRARVLTVSVLAVPGTPSISACPSASKATSTCSIGSSWPTITLRSSFRICAIVEETYSGMGRFIEAQALRDGSRDRGDQPLCHTYRWKDHRAYDQSCELSS